jgi:UDP-N-acetyl-D-glucosamine dehydrogenase
VQELLIKIRDRTANVVVVGGGYVGLPLALAAGVHFPQTTIYDTDLARVERIRLQTSLLASYDQDVLNDADVIVICVPTPLGKSREPDTSSLDALVELISYRIDARRERLVILESTVGPGFTRKRLVPALQTGRNGPGTIGRTLFVAFSPERTDPGNTRHTLANTPKLVAGHNTESLILADKFYSAFVERVVTVVSTDVAEMAKLLENTYRQVNIALANEMAVLCHALGIDVWAVIDAAKTKPFGFQPFYPGPGPGGHCIPVDPLYLTWELREGKHHARMIETADEVNREMPRYVVDRIAEALNREGKAVKGARVLLVGVAYKSDVPDVREAPALDVWRVLAERGAFVNYDDPHVLGVDGVDGRSHGPAMLEGDPYDIAVVLTDHSFYDYEKLLSIAQLVLDCRNAFGARGIAREKIITL